MSARWPVCVSSFLVAILVCAIVPTAHAEVKENGRLGFRVCRQIVGIAIDAIQFKTELGFVLGYIGEYVPISGPSPKIQSKMADSYRFENAGLDEQVIRKRAVHGRNVGSPWLRDSFVVKGEGGRQISFEGSERIPVNMVQEVACARRSEIVPFDCKDPAHLIAPWRAVSTRGPPFDFPIVDVSAQLDASRSFGAPNEFFGRSRQANGEETENYRECRDKNSANCDNILMMPMDKNPTFIEAEFKNGVRRGAIIFIGLCCLGGFAAFYWCLITR